MELLLRLWVSELWVYNPTNNEVIWRWDLGLKSSERLRSVDRTFEPWLDSQALYPLHHRRSSYNDIPYLDLLSFIWWEWGWNNCQWSVGPLSDCASPMLGANKCANNKYLKVTGIEDNKT